MIDAKLTGLDELRRQLPRVPAATQRHVGQAIEQTAAAVLQDAKAAAPVRTGRLRAALAIRLTRAGNRIRARVAITDPVAATYAAHAEFGTTRTPARPFLHPAAHGQASRHQARLAEAGRAIESELQR